MERERVTTSFWIEFLAHDLMKQLCAMFAQNLDLKAK